MFANATFKVGISQRVVATLVACAVVLMSVGIYNIAQAATLTDIRDTLSDSAPNTVSNHTIEFTIPAGSSGVAAGGGTITIEMPAGFGFGSVVVGDVDLVINSSDQTLTAGAPGATEWQYSRSGQIITFTSGASASAAATDPIIVRIGTNATGGANQITNHITPASYELAITAGADTGRTRVAIVNTVLVEAVVDTSFQFTISAVASSTAVNGETTTGTTTATSIDFGQLSANSPEVLAQRLNVTTNAANGFVVTVESDSGFESANGADIDIFDEGVDTANPTIWAPPTPVVSLENTWGHWGVTSSDSDLNSLGGYYTGEFDANEFIAVSSTSPRQVFHHNGPSNGTENNTGSTTVAYKVAITALQEAADDYSTVLTYIATPTF